MKSETLEVNSLLFKNISKDQMTNKNDTCVYVNNFDTFNN